MIVNVLALLAGIFSVILAVIVLAEGANTKRMRIAYALFAGSVGLWAVFLGLFLNIDSHFWAGLFVPLYYCIGLFIPCAFLLFCLAYLSIPVSKVIKFLILVPWVGMMLVIVNSSGMIDAIDAGPAKTVDLVQSTYVVYTTIFVVYVLIGAWFLVNKAARATRMLAHRRIVAFALLIGFLGAGYFDIFLPLIGDYRYIAYGPLFAFLTSAGVFYVIARHGLFNIRFTVIRTVNYMLSLLTLCFIYLLVAFVVFNVLLNQESISSQLFFNLSLTILLALLFQPVKHFFDRITNQLFYRYTYDTEEVYATINRLLSATTDLKRLLSSVSDYISVSLKAKQVFFFVYVDDEKFMRAGTTNHTKLPLVDARWLDEYVKRNGNTVLHDYGNTVDPALHKFMVSHRIKLIVPLVKENEVISYLCLGHHQKRNYVKRDIRLLQTISSELVIAIQNALSVEQIKQLNANLEQRVDAATKELRRSNAQLQKLDETKDEFISMASHQLRTPLTSIKGYLSMMIEGDIGTITPEQKKVLSEAFMSSERMVRLISDFLNVSRLQTGKFVIEKHPIDLAKLVQREIESLKPNAEARGMKFVYKMPKDIPELNLDENKIEQVVMNFCDNAIFYSKEKGTVTVTLKKVSNWVELTVEDDGIGVPAAEQPGLFNKFYRASNAKRARPDGTGVGLFLAKKVIDDHDGQIIFKSKEGKGSTFGFKLPLPK